MDTAPQQPAEPRKEGDTTPPAPQPAPAPEEGTDEAPVPPTPAE